MKQTSPRLKSFLLWGVRFILTTAIFCLVGYLLVAGYMQKFEQWYRHVITLLPHAPIFVTDDACLFGDMSCARYYRLALGLLALLLIAAFEFYRRIFNNDDSALVLALRWGSVFGLVLYGITSLFAMIVPMP